MTGIDHLVLAVADLDAARARYAGLGFTLTPEARHPFGTGNSLVQLEGAFLELVAVKDPAGVPEHGAGRFSFAAFNRDYLKRGEGLSMLVLDSTDTQADARRFAAGGLTTYEPFDFSRKARLPAGEEVTVGFSLAFTGRTDMPDAGFFTCRQHAPEHFWKAEYMRHANTARGVADIWLAADRPDELAEFLQTFADADAAVEDGRVTVATRRGRIVAATPDAVRESFGVVPPDAHRRPCLCAFTVDVDDLDAARNCVVGAALRAERAGDRLVLDPAAMFGAIVAFRQA